MFAQDADTIGLSSEEREEVAKDGVDDVDEEVDDEQMDEVFTGQGGGGDEVQRQLGLQQLAQLRWRPRLHGWQVLQAPPYGHMMMPPIQYVSSGVGVPLRRGFVLPRIATR